MHERIANETSLAAASKGVAPVRFRLTDREAGELLGVMFAAAKQAIRDYLEAVAHTEKRLNPTVDRGEEEPC